MLVVMLPQVWAGSKNVKIPVQKKKVEGVEPLGTTRGTGICFVTNNWG